MTEDLHFEHTTPAVVYDANNGENLADFRCSQFYINNTNSDIIVVHRNNLPVIIGKAANGYNSGKTFIIRNVYHFVTRDRMVSCINAIQAYKKQYNNSESELEILLDVLLKTFNNNRDTRIATIAIDRTVDINQVREHKRLYVPDTDIMLHLDNFDLAYPHPYSSQGRATADYKDFISTKKTSGIFVELIDNENNIKSRYMYVAKRLMEIPVRKDKYRATGVYFSSAQCDRLDDIHIEPQFYSFDEAEQTIGLYKNKEEALSGGNPEHLIKSEYQQKATDLLQAKQDLEQVKHENRIKDLNRTEEISKLKHQQEIKEMELKAKISELEHMNEEIKKHNVRLKEEAEIRSKTRSDYYEERKHSREDTSAVIKYAPAVLLAMLSAAALFKSKT